MALYEAMKGTAPNKTSRLDLEVVILASWISVPRKRW